MNIKENKKLPKAPLKWAGGKSRLSSQIRERIERFENINRFIDLFSGSGTVSILASTYFNNIVMNDTNRELINLYQVIKSEPQELIKLLEKFKLEHSRENYLSIRSLDRSPQYSEMSNIFKAARTIYLNKTGFNGLFRVNSYGFFNVPFANSEFKPDYINLKELSGLLNEIQITFLSLDFMKLGDELKKGDLVYIDPPYDRLENDTFNGYTKERFTQSDQIRLRDLIDELTERGVGVIYSNHSTEFIKTIFEKYISPDDEYLVQRNISADKNKRKKVSELLISNERFI
jgi:DNA adenine methylase